MLDYEYVCDRTANFHKKILFITRVINIQILTTKIFSFQYSVTYCSQALRRPARRACETVHLLTHETPDFITPALWPANSPDLRPNPVDYQIWWKLQDRVYRSHVTSKCRLLKSRLIEEWEHFHQVVIDKAIRQRRPRLGACVRLCAHCGHFEHRLDVLTSCHSHGRTLDNHACADSGHLCF